MSSYTFSLMLDKVFKILLIAAGVIAGLFLAVVLIMGALWYVDKLFPYTTDLGKNIYWIYSEPGDEIVFGESFKDGECTDGSLIVPFSPDDSLYENWEYVSDAASNDEYVIAKTRNRFKDKSRFYVISKNFDPKKFERDEFIRSHVLMFEDSLLFAEECRSLQIPLLFKKSD